MVDVQGQEIFVPVRVRRRHSVREDGLNVLSNEPEGVFVFDKGLRNRVRWEVPCEVFEVKRLDNVITPFDVCRLYIGLDTLIRACCPGRGRQFTRIIGREIKLVTSKGRNTEGKSAGRSPECE